MLAPFSFCSGPRDAAIAIVGEAWGEQDEMAGRPFFGASGQELTRMLATAGIDRSKCFLTSVFNCRAPEGKLDALCGSKAEVGQQYPFPMLSQGKYILPQHLHHVERLHAELIEVRPNLIIAAGNAACWALLQQTGIRSLRGVIAPSIIPGLKLIPTYAPGAVIRNWALRPIVIADLMKAARESAFPEIIRPVRSVIANPTLEEIAQWFSTAPLLYSVDIETYRKQITCVGFAKSRSNSLVVPFVNSKSQNKNYWPSLAEELTAWLFVKAALESEVPKLFQNGLYDLQYLIRAGIRPRNAIHDTMLLHHSLYPEMEKSLGFLGSIYSNEAAWKMMNRKKLEKSVKANE